MAVGSKVGEAYIELTAKMAKFEAQLRSAKMLTGTATAKMQTGMNNVAAATKGTSAAMKLLKVAIGAISFIAIAMAFKKIVQATAQFEDAQLELRKTSGMTREEIDKFSNRMKHMASTMPTSTTGLLEIAAAAARLGIQGSDNLAAFSETVIKMATATQYTEEQASLDFAKIANVMKLPYSEIGRLGSAMNELANTTTATAPIIGDFTRRVAGAGSTLGLTIPQLTAMGATLDSLGVTTQVAGTAISNFFTKMLTKAKTFADQAGMKMEEWNHLVEVDAWEALQKWLSAMDKMKPIERAQALGELGMEGARMTDVLMKLSGAQEQLNVNLATSQKAFEENTSLEKEYQIALEGLSAQWAIFTGNVVNLAITIGAKLSPALKEIMKGLNVLIDGLQFLINNWTQVWESAYQILIETLNQIGHGIKKFFTDWSAFKAGLNLWYQYGKAVLMSMDEILKMLAGLIARASSVIWAPYIKTLQWVADNMVYYFRLAIEDVKNIIIKGVNWITSNVFTPMANFFIDAANKMREGAQAFVNFFISGMNMVVKAIKPVISALGWFAEHILKKELPEGIKEFGEIAKVEFKKIERLGEDALTIQIPESTLKQPAKFSARMSEAWEIIKGQYSKIPGDLKKYVDDLGVEWENVTEAAGEFKDAVDWSDYKKKVEGIITKLKAAGVDTSVLEKEMEKFGKTAGPVLYKAKEGMESFGGATKKTTEELTKLEDRMNKLKAGAESMGLEQEKMQKLIAQTAMTATEKVEDLRKQLGLTKESIADVFVSTEGRDAVAKAAMTATEQVEDLRKQLGLAKESIADVFAATEARDAAAKAGTETAEAFLYGSSPGGFLPTIKEAIEKHLAPIYKKQEEKMLVDWNAFLDGITLSTFRTYKELHSFLEELSAKDEATLARMFQDWQSHVGKIANIWKSFTSSVKDSFEEVFIGFVKGTSTVEQAWNSLVDIIKNKFLTAMAQAILVQLNFNELLESIDWGADSFKNLTEKIGSFMEKVHEVWEKATDTLLKGWEKIGAEFDESKVKIEESSNSVKRLTENVKETVRAVRDLSKNWPQLGWEGLVSKPGWPGWEVFPEHQAFVGNYQLGGIVPRTGLAKVEKGERIIPAGRSSTTSTRNYSFNFTVMPGAKMTKSELRQMVQYEIRPLMLELEERTY